MKNIFNLIAVISLLLAEHLSAQNLVSLGNVHPGYLYKLSNGRYVFSGYDDTHGLEPWVTDGTSNGTFILKDILLGQASSTAAFYFPKAIPLGNNLLLFVATDSLNIGEQIWATDGTSSGTFKLLDQGLPWGANDFLFFPETVNGKVFFIEGLSTDPYPHLWATDGSSAGTFEIYDSIPWILVPYVSSTILNNLFYFYSQSITNQIELWRSDGTAQGTYKITNTVHAGVGLLSLITYNDKIYFAAYDSLHGNELWSTDGSINGTSLFKDLIPGIADSRPENFTLFQDKLFFITNSDYGDYKGTLWRSDGTSIGTTKVTLTGNTIAGGQLTILGSSGDLLYFEQYGYDSALVAELWRTDGSDSGTWKVATFPNPNLSFNIFGEGIDYTGDFYFVASDDDYDYGFSSLWTSDGTPQGTYSIYDNPSYGYTPTISQLKVICDSLFFSVYNEDPYPYGETELWATDGNNFDHLDFLPYAPEGTTILLNDNGKVFLSILDTAINNYFGISSGLYLFNDCAPSAVTEISADKTFEVFPNPANNKIEIKIPFGATSIMIHDVLGNLVKQKSIAGTSISSTEEIDIGNLASGIYLITLENRNDQMSAKLVKE